MSRLSLINSAVAAIGVISAIFTIVSFYVYSPRQQVTYAIERRELDDVTALGLAYYNVDEGTVLPDPICSTNVFWWVSGNVTIAESDIRAPLALQLADETNVYRIDIVRSGGSGSIRLVGSAGSYRIQQDYLDPRTWAWIQIVDNCPEADPILTGTLAGQRPLAKLVALQSATSGAWVWLVLLFGVSVLMAILLRRTVYPFTISSFQTWRQKHRLRHLAGGVSGAGFIALVSALLLAFMIFLVPRIGYSGAPAPLSEIINDHLPPTSVLPMMT